MSRDRLQRLRHALAEKQLDGLLVSNETNVRYLTGFTGDSAYALVTADSELLLCDRRYEEQLASECPSWQRRIRGPGISLLNFAVEQLRSCGLSRLGFEPEHLSYQAASTLFAGLPGCQLVAASGDVERLRLVKDPGELGKIREAIRQAEASFISVVAELDPQQTELEVAWNLEAAIRREGGAGCSFPPIVALDGHAALPHASPRRVKLSGHSLLLIDWGAVHEGYISDLTRVVSLGPASDRLRAIHRIVRDAQAAAFREVRSGVPRSRIDGAAREVIRQAGYGDNFSHALGHGIGRQVHEAPRLAEDQTECLEAGMVITLEPAIYLPGWGGIRLEDDVLVTETAGERLSSLSLELDAYELAW